MKKNKEKERETASISLLAADWQERKNLLLSGEYPGRFHGPAFNGWTTEQAVEYCEKMINQCNTHDAVTH